MSLTLLSLPRELVLEIFSFHALPETYLSLLLTCRDIQESFTLLHSVACRLMYETLDSISHRLAPLSRDLPPLKLIRLLCSIPTTAQKRRLEERLLLRHADAFFRLSTVYSLAPRGLVIFDTESGSSTGPIYRILRIERKDPKRLLRVQSDHRKRKFRRDRLFELEVVPYSPEKRGVSVAEDEDSDDEDCEVDGMKVSHRLLYGNDVVMWCAEAASEDPKKHPVRYSRHRITGVSLEHEVLLQPSRRKKSDIVSKRLKLPRGAFGRAIVKIEELVNIFLGQERGLCLFGFVVEIVGGDGRVLEEDIVDLQVVAVPRRTKRRRRGRGRGPRGRSSNTGGRA